MTTPLGEFTTGLILGIIIGIGLVAAVAMAVYGISNALRRRGGS